MRRVRLASAAALLLVMTGCAGVGQPNPGGEPGEIAPGGGVEVLVPSFSLDCADLLEIVKPAAQAGDTWESYPPSGVGMADFYGLASAAFFGSGGISCAWRVGDGASATVRVLPDAASQWQALRAEVAVFEPRQDEFGAGSQSSCQQDRCAVNLLAGEHWLQVSASLGKAAMQRMVEALAPVITDAPAVPRTPGPAWAPSCESLVTAADQQELLGGSLRADDSFIPVQPVVLYAAFQDEAGGHCYWRGTIAGQDAALRIGALPDATSLWRQHWSAQPDAAAKPVDTIPAPTGAQEAVQQCDREHSCSVSVLADGWWVSVHVIRGTGEPAAAAAAVAGHVVSTLLQQS